MLLSRPRQSRPLHRKPALLLQFCHGRDPHQVSWQPRGYQHRMGEIHAAWRAGGPTVSNAGQRRRPGSRPLAGGLPGAHPQPAIGPAAAHRRCASPGGLDGPGTIRRRSRGDVPHGLALLLRSRRSVARPGPPGGGAPRSGNLHALLEKRVRVSTGDDVVARDPDRGGSSLKGGRVEATNLAEHPPRRGFVNKVGMALRAVRLLSVSQGTRLLSKAGPGEITDGSESHPYLGTSRRCAAGLPVWLVIYRRGT